MVQIQHCPVPSDLSHRQACDLGWLSLSGRASGGCGRWPASECEPFRRARIPIPDQDEQHELIISAFTTKAREDLDKLARDIAAAARDGQTGEAAVAALHKRFVSLQAATAEHARLLNTSLDDATGALKLVNVQLASLLAQAS
jgi:hypothetical protein